MKLIWKTVVGSQLYGLATEDSDVDYKGIFMPDKSLAYPTKSQAIGIESFKHFDLKEFKEGEGPNKEEGTFYSARYFLKLFLKGNPTLAEIPFVKEEFTSDVEPCGALLMQFIRDHMITKHLHKGYKGFFEHQVKAFRTGKGKSREKRLRKGAKLPEGYLIPNDLRQAFENPEFDKDWGDGNKSSASKDVVEALRHCLIAQGWYDGKMMSHAYRIGVQGVQLFRDGVLKPTLEGQDLEIARAMKTLGDASPTTEGRISREEAIKMVEQAGKDLDAAKDNNKDMPDRPDAKLASQFIVDLLESYYGAYMMESDYGIVALFETPLEEVYFVDTNKLKDNSIQKRYLDLIKEAIDNEEEHVGRITIDDRMAVSAGAYNEMSSALVYPPCQVSHSLVVEVET